MTAISTIMNSFQNTIPSLTSTQVQVFTNPVPNGHILFSIIDSSGPSFIGGGHMIVISGQDNSIVNLTGSYFLTTSDGSSVHWSYGSRIFTLEYSSNLFYLKVNTSITGIVVKGLMLPGAFAGHNIFGADYLRANSPTAGSQIVIQSPVSLSYTGPNALSFGQSTITQVTSTDTPVTINSAAGVITMVSSVLGALQETTFQVNNTTVSSSSVVVANICGYSGTTGFPMCKVLNVTSGSFQIRVRNVSVSDLLNGILKIAFICC